MSITLKPVREQVMVITGASSGIGLATARGAAKQGARLVLASRSTTALVQLGDELRASGARVHIVPTDVSRPNDVGNLADQAISEFGGFDTWVNNAGTSIYGKIVDIPLDDMKRLFDTNFWGIVCGSQVAVNHLRVRGGALINLGSVVSDRSVPLQGAYAATKHAIKGFTDALRMELEADNAPVSVTLVKPAAIDTPFPRNAKNYLDMEPQHIPPVYAPEAVADAILHCAANPVRDVYVGAGSKLVAAMGSLAPRLTDVMMEKSVISGTQGSKPASPRENNALEHPSEHLAARGDYPGHVAHGSLYTQASLHPVLTGAAMIGVGMALSAALSGNGDRKRGSSVSRALRRMR